MKIHVIDIKDLENGGAEFIVDVDEEAKRLLINLGFIAAIEQGVARVQKLWEEDTKDE